MTTVLAIDVGTTNWKAALFKTNGSFVDRRSVPTVTRQNTAGAYYDPAEMWSAVSSVVRDLLSANSTCDVAAISVTSIAESGVPLGADGEPAYESIAWYDPRSTEDAARALEVIGRERFFAITGLDPNPIFSLFKLLWMRRCVPDRFAVVKRWIWIGDYINYRLTGEVATDYSLASRTMMLDIHAGTWSDEILSALSIDPSILPPIRSSGETIGRVSDGASTLTGLPSGTPVILGGHDHHCAFLAAGALARDLTLDSSGTVESIMRLLPPGAKAPTVSRELRVGYFVDPSRYATMAGVLGAGVSVDWAMRSVWMGANDDVTIPAETYDEAMRAVASVAPGEDIPFYLPHIRGAGAPHWDVRSRGAFVGLTSNHGRRELLRAVIEGLCLELRVLLEAVEHAFGSPPATLLTVGGGAKNAVWQQIKSDITGLVVETPDVNDATAQGAALIACVGSGFFDSLSEASGAVFKLKERFEPRRQHAAYYDELFDAYSRIYPALREISAAKSERHTGEKG